MVREDRMLFNVEFQRFRDGPDADPFDLEIVPRALADEGYDVDDVDEWSSTASRPGRTADVGCHRVVRRS